MGRGWLGGVAATLVLAGDLADQGEGEGSPRGHRHLSEADHYGTDHEVSGDQVPAVQQFGSAVLLQGPAVVDVWHLVALGVRAAHRDGIGLARVDHLQAVLAAAAAEVRATSEAGQGDVAQEPARAGSDPSEPLTTREVATMLGLSPRQTQRMARTLDARRLRCGRLLFDRGAVDAYLADHHSGKGLSGSRQ